MLSVEGQQKGDPNDTTQSGSLIEKEIAPIWEEDMTSPDDKKK